MGNTKEVSGCCQKLPADEYRRYLQEQIRLKWKLQKLQTFRRLFRTHSSIRDLTMAKKIAEHLDGLELFKDFTFQDLERLSRYLMYMVAAKGDVIFNEGDPGSYMLILIDGRMEISKSGDGGFHLLSYEGKGRVVGEMSLLDHERRSATCVAACDCELLALNPEGLDRMTNENPALAFKVMTAMARLLSRRLRRTSGMLADFLGS